MTGSVPAGRDLLFLHTPTQVFTAHEEQAPSPAAPFPDLRLQSSDQLVVCIITHTTLNSSYVYHKTLPSLMAGTGPEA